MSVLSALSSWFDRQVDEHPDAVGVLIGVAAFLVAGLFGAIE